MVNLTIMREGYAQPLTVSPNVRYAVPFRRCGQEARGGGCGGSREGTVEDGVARRQCEEHVAYQWLCGGVPMNHTTLAAFRTAHVAFLDTLLTRSVATLRAEGLVTLQRVTQDGMRVRASAGAASFRRRPTLERCLAEAEAQVQTLRAELEADPAGARQRERAARERAARDGAARVAQALTQLSALEAKKKPPSPPPRRPRPGYRPPIPTPA